MARVVSEIGRGISRTWKWMEGNARKVRDIIMPSYKMAKDMYKSSNSTNVSTDIASSDLSTPVTTEVSEEVKPISTELTPVETGGENTQISTPIQDIPESDRLTDTSVTGLGEIEVDLPSVNEIINPLEKEEEDFLLI